MTKHYKKLLLLAMLLLTSLIACSCGDKGDGINMDDLEYKMITAASTLPQMMNVDSKDKDASKSFMYLVEGIDYRLVESYFYYYSATASADEIAVIKMKDQLDVASVKLALERHIDDRVETLKTYNPDQVDKAKSARVISSGNYIALIMCDNPSDVKKVFLDEVDK